MGFLSAVAPIAGGLSKVLSGGSKQSSNSSGVSDSSNRAYDFLQGQFGGMTGNAQQGTDAISAMLGLGGDVDGQRASFDNFRKGTGYDFMMNEGQHAITNNMASKGLLNSGAALKGLTRFGQGMADQSYGSYMDRLLGLANTGFQAGNLISGAGNVSHSTQQSKSSGGNSNGIGGFLGGLFSGIAGGK